MRVERGGAYGLLGPLRQHIRTQPRGWPLCHGISGILDLPQGDPRYLPQCLFVKKATGSSLLWGSMEKDWTICNILSSLTGWLHRCRYPAATGEDQESEEEWLLRPNRRESYEEVLRVAHQRALDTAKVL